jgi:hypothetical protein
LLVIWTRYVGPDWASEQIATDGGEPVEDLAGAAGDGPVAMTNGHGAGTLAHRTVDYEHVRPAQEIEVTVTLEEYTGRVGLRETFDGTTVRVSDVRPAPASVTAHGRTVYAVWDLAGEPARLTYTARIPGDAPDGATYGFDGDVLTDAEDGDVSGEDAASVVTDLFERVVARGTVTDDDLAAAEERLRAGQLTEGQFERIYRAWLGDEAALASEREVE